MIYLNDMPVEPTKFPDGTTQVWKIHPEIFNLSYVNLRWKFESEAEFIHLAQLKELHTCKINSGLFKVPWELTEKILQDSGEKFTVYEP